MNTSELIAQFDAIHNIGIKIFCAQSPTYALPIKNYLDLAIGNSSFTSDQITEFQATGHKVYSYGNPQTVAEYPLVFRINYGLSLWQKGYSGAFPYAFQHSFQDIWSDFDDEFYRDHCFTYPAADKPIDTIQWEGFREGVNDIRYLVTLQAAVAEAKSRSVDTTTIDNWLTTLKTTDLTTLNMDTVRSQMVTYILQLQV
jgi:hypothetical protein